MTEKQEISDKLVFIQKKSETNNNVMQTMPYIYNIKYVHKLF